MATSQPTFAMWQANDAAFRTWVQAVIDGIVAVGLVQTADTGQIDTATVLAPVAGSTEKGYAVFAFDDSLQATYPVYIKIGFGSASLAGTIAMTIQAGSATDGAGTLTGTVGQRLGILGGLGANTPQVQYFAGATNRMALAVRVGAATASGIFLFAERLKNADGTDSSDGVVYGTNPSSSGITWTTNFYGGLQVLEWGKAVPNAWIGIWPGVPLGAGATANAIPTTSSSGGNIYVMPIIPVGWKAWNPIESIQVYYNADIATNTTFNVDIYGTTRNMRSMASELYSTNAKYALTNAAGTLSNNVYAMMANF